MGYQSLVPPKNETPDDSDSSIQGSPLLETGQRFQPIEDATETSFDFQDGPYADPDYDDEYQGTTYPSNYNWIPQTSPGGRPTVKSVSPPQPTTRESHAGPSMTPVLEDPPIFDSAQDSTPEKFEQTYENQSASLRRKNVQNRKRRTMPPNFPLHGTGDQDDMAIKSSLNFDIKPARPSSTFIRGSFNAPKLENGPTEEDEDALPFETTKQMAWQGRPKSMLQLSDLERGPVMTRETFENYRKSMSSLGMLKHMSSSGSFRSDGSDGKRNGYKNPKLHDGEKNELSDGDDDDALDDEDEELTHEQDKKRYSAKIRQEQDARMSVYRQRMTKIIGGSIEPSVTLDHKAPMGDDRSSLSHTAVLTAEDDGSEDDEMMDDIPLSILQAHGFPKSRRKSHGSSSPGIKAVSSDVPSLSPQQHSPNSMSPRPVSTSRMSVMTRSSPGPSGIGNGGSISPYMSRGASNLSLPPVFGNKDAGLSRGLISEIAKEEEYRKRRHTFGFDSIESQESRQQMHKGPSIPSGMNPQRVPTQPNELQNKLDQVLDLLTKMNTNETGSMHSGVVPGGIRSTPPNHAFQRAPSIRSSYTTQSSHSMDPYMNNQYMGHQSGMMSGIHTPQSPFMGAHMMHPPQMHPQMQQSPLPPSSLFYPLRGGAPGPGSHNVSNRPSRMRVVNTDKDDEDDDDAEWQKLMDKKKALRDQWSQREEIPSA